MSDAATGETAGPDPWVEFAEEPSADDLRSIAEGVMEAAGAGLAAAGYVPFSFLARSAGGKLVGGVVGNTGGPWLYVSALWVAAPLRGRGLGSSLMDHAEALGARRGCTGAYLDTLSAGAVGFYRNRGYEVFGKLDGSGDGGARWFLRRALGPSDCANSPSTAWSRPG